MGAASKESYNEDTYPNLLHRYLKFDDEMSVISVVWRDSQQLIEQYNEEQVRCTSHFIYFCAINLNVHGFFRSQPPIM